MKLNKIAYILGVFGLMAISYRFGFINGKEDVKCDDCSYWMREVYDVVYIGSKYQDMYYACLGGKEYPESESTKKMIDDLVSKYKLNEGVARP